MSQYRIDNSFTLIGMYSSKWYFSFSDYHMKLSHCHVDLTATAVRPYLELAQTSILHFLAKN